MLNTDKIKNFIVCYSVFNDYIYIYIILCVLYYNNIICINIKIWNCKLLQFNNSILKLSKYSNTLFVYFQGTPHTS